jgi:hypothetical protein
LKHKHFVRELQPHYDVNYYLTGKISKDSGNTGGGKAYNHGFTGTASTIDTMPQYITCYIWRRTS